MKKVLAGGCFNKIHPGHIYFLKKAKEFGYLIIVLTHDKNNKKPYAIPATKRKNSLAELKIADKIVIGNPKNFSTIVKKEKPDIIALGYDQRLPEGISKRIKTVRIKRFRNYKTSRLA
jgi:FAD synthetase